MYIADVEPAEGAPYDAGLVYGQERAGVRRR